MYNRLHDVLSGSEQNYMLPFYWLHGDHYDTIPKEIRRIYDSGCRAFCVESRPHKEFVGEGWWRDMDLILSEAKKLGMEVWILDDDHFPTGHAVGHIEKYHPELARWDLSERHLDVVGPADRALLMTQETETHRLLGIYAYKRTGEKELCSPEEVLDFTDKVKDGFCEITLPEGVWRVFFLYRTRDLATKQDYIDMLDPTSVRVLIDAVYEPHYDHYKDYFGTVIKGFFSDEPQLGNWWHDDGRHAVDPGFYEGRLGMFGMDYPWHPTVLEEMQAQLGFDPMPWLAALWTDLGEVTSKLRLAYMDAVTRIRRDSFTRQLGDWCSEHGVEYIGHVIEDMNAHKRTGGGTGHFFRALDGQHMSGMDIVLHQLMPGLSDHIHTASLYGNNVDPEFFDYTLGKMTSSLAHIGTEMKGRAMCEMFGAFGWAEGAGEMKWILDHLLVRGMNYFVPHAFSPSFPDPDCPPHFGANDMDPQFEAFGKLMRYGNKAAHLLSGGRHVADAAILYDAEFEWMNGDTPIQFMQVPAKLLYDANIDFDILPIDCILGAEDARLFPAETENGLLKVGEETYRVLIIPEAPIIPENLKRRLDALREAGVTVLRIGEDCKTEELLSRLNESFTPDVEIFGQKKFLRVCHYAEGGNDIYMFVNESTALKADCTVRLNGAQSSKGVCLDLLNDTVYRVMLQNGEMPLVLEPNQSCIFVFGEGNAEGIGEKKNWKPAAKAPFTFRMEIADAEALADYTLLQESVSAEALFSVTALDQMPAFSGRIRYTAKFDAADAPKAEALALDLGKVGGVTHLYLNGEDLGIRVTRPYIYDLTGKVKNGENRLVIEVSNTLANKIRDQFSAFMVIPAAGLLEQPCFMTE